jgi:competence protein ComEC
MILWRSSAMRSTAIVFAAFGLAGAFTGPRYDVIVPPSGDLAAIRDADDRLDIVGKRFNAFAAEQWLAADADDRVPAAARDPQPSCDRFGCVGDMPEGKSLSIVTDRAGFDEDCERADIVVSPLTAPAFCKPAALFDERRLAETGAVGLNFDNGRWVEALDRSPLQDRPWSPALKRPRDDRVVRPGEHAAPAGADPADAAGEGDAPSK